MTAMKLLDQEKTKDLLRQIFNINNMPDSVIEAIAMPAIEHLADMIGESSTEVWLENLD